MLKKIDVGFPVVLFVLKARIGLNGNALPLCVWFLENVGKRVLLTIAGTAWRNKKIYYIYGVPWRNKKRSDRLHERVPAS